MRKAPEWAAVNRGMECETPDTRASTPEEAKSIFLGHAPKETEAVLWEAFQNAGWEIRRVGRRVAVAKAH